MSAQAAFDLCGPLPSGISVLEASAGTGKTYTIAGLAARYVAEGTPLERLLLVTFTRIATGELRERVRERLISVRRGLAETAAGVAPADPIVALLAGGEAQEVLARGERLARAIADFDAATIATTHGFCQEVLSGLGIAADLEPDVSFVEDLSDVVGEVVDDLYVRRFHRHDGEAMPFAQAKEIVRAAIDNPEAEIVSAEGAWPQMRERLASAARRELALRKRRLAVMGYDDLLTALRQALRGPDGSATAARLRARFDVVLVDEFQDTDATQWEIMRLAFGDTDRSLILIADPKQAIYAFRGADVYSYLDAARTATSRETLRTNWRSDQGLIDAYDALFAGAKLGHEGIRYRRVQAAPGGRGGAGRGRCPVGAPLRVRIVSRDALVQTPGGYAQVGSARGHVAADVAGEIVALLDSGARLTVPGRASSEPVRPGHIAVLVPTNRHAAQIREALERAAVPAVISGAGSVFATAPAREWLTLLEALERPGSAVRAHGAALTSFLAWSAEQVACAGDADWERLHRRLHDLARVLRTGGVATLLELITASEGLPERLLRRHDGERVLTDLRHVGQLLHAHAAAEQLGVSALRAWLARRIADAGRDAGNEERSRRLESDAEAVQVLTVHRSKGLEFPIVHVPFLWEPGFIPREDGPVSFHDPEDRDRRGIDVALEGPAYRAHRRQFVLEQRGEDLRLAYVALTRARHQAVVWWAASYSSRDSALGRLLLMRDDEGNIAVDGGRVPSDEAVRERWRALGAQTDGCISVEESVLGAPSAWSGPARVLSELDAASFDRDLDLRWRRTSYTDISSGAHEERVASEPEAPLIADEPSLSRAVGFQDAVTVPLGWAPAGTRFGTFVHGVLEAADFAASDLAAELAFRIGDRDEFGEHSVVAGGLALALRTPLGPLLGGARLCDFSRRDRLDELGFELPLAGGDRPHGCLTVDAFADVLRAHLDDRDPLAGYAQRLSDPALRRQVRGYLTGSLDLVVRLELGGAQRFAAIDYKTNWLGGPEEALSVWHHRPAALRAEMQRRHYALQALLYSVALHRFLRWRLPEHDPDRDIAGVLYLFLRGMIGDDTPAGYGVFSWRPPAGLVAALSDVLDEGVT